MADKFDGPGYSVLTLTGVSGNSEIVNMPMYPKKTIQAVGTGTVTLEGSPDGTNWGPLNDALGVAISLAAASNEAADVLENTVYMRANVATGTATITIVGSGRGL